MSKVIAKDIPSDKVLGDKIKKGQTAVVHYTGRLNDEKGQKFDSSVDRNKPFEFQAQMVISGWGIGIFGDDEEIQPMQVGGKRALTIPPEYGYGATSAGVIPPNATLYFEVELLAIK